MAPKYNGERNKTSHGARAYQVTVGVVELDMQTLQPEPHISQVW